MCEIILAGYCAQMKADRRMRENEHGIHMRMMEGSDEVDEFYRSKASAAPDAKSDDPVRAPLPQRGTMPGRRVEGGREAGSEDTLPQRGTWPAEECVTPLVGLTHLLTS